MTLAVLGACIERREVARPQSDLDRLTGWMAGSFSSQAQAETDTGFFDIRLEMVQIWPERTDGRWLYVEQASAASLERPYRQRVYHLMQTDDTTFISAVFEFAEPLRMAGAWRSPELLDRLTPDSLIQREGCAIVLRPRGDTLFVGSTVEDRCRSDHRGAAYTTSEVRIGENYLYSWDRGWDSTGAQVWGAETGGYMFRKLREP
jgi:hypothetical protein